MSSYSPYNQHNNIEDYEYEDDNLGVLDDFDNHYADSDEITNNNSGILACCKLSSFFPR